MANAVAASARAFKNGTITLMARVVGADDAAITQADISSIVYSIYTLDQNCPDSQEVVDGHDSEGLLVASTIYDTLQTDSRWTVDSTGYNFLHEIDVSSDEAFTVRGDEYLVDFSLTPASGQVIDVQYKVTCV